MSEATALPTEPPIDGIVCHNENTGSIKPNDPPIYVSETVQGLRLVRQGVLPPGHHRAGLLWAEVPRLQQHDAVAGPGAGDQEAVD